MKVQLFIKKGMKKVMMDEKNSKWLQEMAKLTAKKKKELMKQDAIRTGCIFLIGVVIIIAAKIAKSSFGMAGVFLACLAVFYELIFLFMRLGMSTRALEKQMKKVLVTDELFEQFEYEMVHEPKGLVEITNGRVVFTEHFVMSQYENPAQYRFSSILLWDKMDEMDTTIYKTNGQTNGIVTRFYKPGEKKACQHIEFKVAKDSDSFLTKLTEMKPDIRLR